MLWLHPDLVHAARPGGGQALTADPDIGPIAQMRKVFSPNMYVLLFQNDKAADTAMAKDPSGTLNNSYRKKLITSREWTALPPALANMEYYGQPLPAKPPGCDVINAKELSFYAERFARTGFTSGINWYSNITRNWSAHRSIDQTIRIPSLMIYGERDVVLRPSMTDQMSAWVPDLERHVVTDTWHWVPEEKPDELNRLAVGWLKNSFPS